VLPEAKQISLEHALSGVEEAKWVEMRGYFRRIDTHDGLPELEIATSGGDFVAVLPTSEDVSHLIGAVVRLHGVCTASADEQRKLTGIRLWVPSASYVQVEEPAPGNPFDVPLRSLSSLGQFGNLQSFTERLRVAGVVLHHVPGHILYLQEGSDTLRVFSRETGVLHPGDKVEAVGFLGRQGARIGLREAVYRKTGSDAQPEPRSIDVENLSATAEDGRLVKLGGTLIDSSSTGGQLRLTLQAGNTIFEAFLETSRAAVAESDMENGSRLALTGVCEVKYDEYGKAAAFQIALRTTGDIVVLRHPSWFTRQRILAFAGTFGLGTVIFMAWVAALRRRVKAQTEQIRDQVQRESWLKDELQRASKIESLGLLAGGIAHDFNNLLTVMMGNLSLIRLDSTLTRDSVQSLRIAERAALRARDLTQQLLTFSKGGAPIRTAVSLPDIVREVAEFALRGSKTRCDFDIPDDLWPANVDKGQIGQVVQNIVINAMQAMADGGHIKISLRNTNVGDELGSVLIPGRYVLLGIADHGPGIRAADLQRIFDPYFTTKKTGNGLGLATVYSIIKKHFGHISAESVPGQETIFKIWLPAAEGVPVPELPLRRTPSSAPVKDNATVLFMDDEETIRNLGRALLSRMGYSVTTTCEGAETIREYRRAWEAKLPYDLVILDLTIPGGMGGRETMEELKKFDPGIRAIVSSGYSNDLVLSNYHAHGFRGMISKPYEISDFSHAIEQVLGA
jgi:two-component system cell cycle sensor histidine kinase/response regulator CckA